jgi:hypothetical protein
MMRILKENKKNEIVFVAIFKHFLNVPTFIIWYISIFKEKKMGIT